MDCFAALAKTTKRTFAASPRDAPDDRLREAIHLAAPSLRAKRSNPSCRKERMDCFAALAMTGYDKSTSRDPQGAFLSGLAWAATSLTRSACRLVPVLPNRRCRWVL